MYYLVLNQDTPEQQTYELKFGLNKIGREHDNDIVIDDRKKSISRYHAEIRVLGDRVLIKDLGSLNHTCVNHIQIKEHYLAEGDIVHVGYVPLVFKRTVPKSNLIEDEEVFSIIKRLSPETTIAHIEDLVNETTEQGSVLKLRHDDPRDRAMAKVQVLLEVSKQLASPDDTNILLNRILELLFQIMDVDRAAILLVDLTTNDLQPKATRFRVGITKNDRFYSRHITQTVLQTGVGLLTANAQSDRRFSNATSVMQQSIHASMCVPLKPREQVIGVLYVDNLSLPNVYTEEDLEFLTGLANQAAVAISKAYFYRKAQDEAVMRAKLERFFPKAVTQKIREEGTLKIVETEVTALFSDITGFTELASSMAPQQVLEMLNEYFSVMVEDIVFRYGGTLEKYIADALLAVWGSPYQQPNDTQCAVLAAIDMQWAMHRLNHQWQQEQRDLQIQIHIGLNTGRVAAGNIGSRELIQYTHIGDTMNVASRICNQAAAGQILISQATLDRLGTQTFPVERLDPVMVKGKAEPLQLYQLLWQQVPEGSRH